MSTSIYIYIYIYIYIIFSSKYLLNLFLRYLYVSMGPLIGVGESVDTNPYIHYIHERNLTYIIYMNFFFRYLYESMGPFIGVGESRHSGKLKVVVDTLSSVIKEKGYMLQDNEKLSV